MSVNNQMKDILKDTAFNIFIGFIIGITVMLILFGEVIVNESQIQCDTNGQCYRIYIKRVNQGADYFK